MFRLTCIELNYGEFAVYINNHYLGSEDASSERLCLGDILEQLSLLPGVEKTTLRSIHCIFLNNDISEVIACCRAYCVLLARGFLLYRTNCEYPIQADHELVDILVSPRS